ncbi:hypothetical protein Peur_006370 [Populus x canadensis]
MRKFDPWPVFFKREWNRNWPFLVGFAITGALITKFSLSLTEEDAKNSPFVQRHKKLIHYILILLGTDAKRTLSKMSGLLVNLEMCSPGSTLVVDSAVAAEGNAFKCIVEKLLSFMVNLSISSKFLILGPLDCNMILPTLDAATKNDSIDAVETSDRP